MSRYVPVPRAYYFPEDAADYSESEVDAPAYAPWPEQARRHPVPASWHHQTAGAPAASSHLHPHLQEEHVTELYRRKQPDERFMVPQDMVGIDDSPRYYYRPSTRVPQRRAPITSAGHMPTQLVPPATTAGYYGTDLPLDGPCRRGAASTTANPQVFETTVVYHSTPHLHAGLSPRTGLVRRTQQPVVTEQTAGVRRTKPPVTVGTPRYYRRTASSLYKRPSTLCLPLSCQPDPAAYSNNRHVKSRLRSTIPAFTMVTSPRQQLRQQQQHQRQLEQDLQMRNMHRQRRQVMQQPQLRQLPMSSSLPRSAPPTCNTGSSHTIRLEHERLQEIQDLILERRDAMENANGVDLLRSGDEDVLHISEPSGRKNSDLELMLAQYNELCSEDQSKSPRDSSKTEDSGTESRKRRTGSKSSIRSRVRSRHSVNRLVNPAALLKPKTPPSLKEQQTQPKKHGGSKESLKSTKGNQDLSVSNAGEENAELKRATAQVLDKLLYDLNISGFINQTADGAQDEVDKMDEENVKSNMNKQVENGNDEIGGDLLRASSRDDQSNCKKNTVSTVPYNFSEVRHFTETGTSNNIFLQDKFPEPPTDTTFMQDNEKFAQYIHSSHTSFAHDKPHEPETLTHSSSKRNASSHSRQHSAKASATLCGNESKSKHAYKVDTESANGKNASKKSLWTNNSKVRARIPLKMSTDEHSAIELHRSKSYIVNLIDRALSRELGTIPEERSSKQYMSLDARAALDLMASPAAKGMDNELCMEITQALAESLSAPVQHASGCTCTGACSSQQTTSTSTSAGAPNDTLNHGVDCSGGEPDLPNLLFDSHGGAEPKYVKQLKQLRWGHLKSIKREMKRLEDLERFLDSCSSEK